MTPEKLQSWIYRPVTNSRTLTLTYQPPIGQETVIATWTREEVLALQESGGSHGEEVLECAREYMAGAGERDTCKFVLAWFGEKNPNALRSMILKLKPDESTAPPEPIDMVAAQSGAALAQMIPFFLNHISQTQRATIGSIGVLLAAHERTASMQQKIIDGQQTLIQKLLEANDDREPKDSAAIGEAKARVLEKLTNAIPDIVSAGVQLAAGRMTAGNAQPPSTPQVMAPRPTPTTRAELKAAALDALALLEPDEIAELVSTSEDDDGATDDAA